MIFKHWILFCWAGACGTAYALQAWTFFPAWAAWQCLERLGALLFLPSWWGFALRWGGKGEVLFWGCLAIFGVYLGKGRLVHELWLALLFLGGFFLTIVYALPQHMPWIVSRKGPWLWGGVGGVVGGLLFFQQQLFPLFDARWIEACVALAHFKRGEPLEQTSWRYWLLGGVLNFFQLHPLLWSLGGFWIVSWGLIFFVGWFFPLLTRRQVVFLGALFCFLLGGPEWRGVWPTALTVAFLRDSRWRDWTYALWMTGVQKTSLQAKQACVVLPLGLKEAWNLHFAPKQLADWVLAWSGLTWLEKAKEAPQTLWNCDQARRIGAYAFFSWDFEQGPEAKKVFILSRWDCLTAGLPQVHSQRIVWDLPPSAFLTLGFLKSTEKFLVNPPDSFRIREKGLRIWIRKIFRFLRNKIEQ